MWSADEHTQELLPSAPLTRTQETMGLEASRPPPGLPCCGLSPARGSEIPAGYLPGKGVVRKGILMGARVRTWQGCVLEGGGPPSPSGSTETTAVAAAAMATAGPLPMGFRPL